MVFGDLDLDLWPILQKKKCKVSWVCRIYGKKIILIGAKLWPVGGVTDKQTDKQTNRQRARTLTNPLRERVLEIRSRAGTLRNGVAVTDADVVTGYASQRLLLIGIVTDRECKPLTFGLFDNVACLNDSDADMDTDTCTDSWLSTENILQPPTRLYSTTSD